MADEAGWTYREHPSRIPGGFVWSRTVAHGPTRILPDGCIDLIWNEAVVFVAGPDTRAQAYSGKPGTPIRGVRLPPGLGPRVVGVPAYELADRRVPLEDLWDPAEVRRVTELIGAGERAGQVLEDLAHRRAARGAGSGSAGVAGHIARLAAAGTRTRDIAESTGLGERQLHRLCTRSFGYGAKTLTRILRLQRALSLARTGASYADVAARSGYADQAHLARDVKDLAGVPLGALLR